MAMTGASIPRDYPGCANAPRVLWLSPVMRPLARVQAEALRERGIDVLLVTTDQHPESDRARDYELVLDLRFRTASTRLAAQRRIREHRPDVVIAELVCDPRWIALAGRAPRIQLVHDERRNNGGPQRRVYARAVFDRWGSRSAATVTYSNYAAIAVATRRDVADTHVNVVPLCSDLDPALVPPFVGPDERHDFVVAGRLGSHKNIDVVLEAWQRHVDGGGWRGDELLLIGDGPLIIRTLPAYVRWRPGSYRYADVVTTLAAAKGSVVHYRADVGPASTGGNERDIGRITVHENDFGYLIDDLLKHPADVARLIPDRNNQADGRICGGRRSRARTRAQSERDARLFPWVLPA
jgi:glycosyltransferase involved in cell wall biosynthesis